MKADARNRQNSPEEDKSFSLGLNDWVWLRDRVFKTPLLPLILKPSQKATAQSSKLDFAPRWLVLG